MALKNGRKFNIWGYVIFLGGFGLSMIAFFVFDVWIKWMAFFLGLSGTLGLSMDIWGAIGIAAWVFPSFFIPLILAILFGSSKKE